MTLNEHAEAILRAAQEVAYRDAITAPFRTEIERLRAALERVQNAPMVIEGGSVQWCRNVATKALTRQALKGPTDE